MKSEATSPEEYIAALPPDRQEPMARLRTLILQNLDDGFEEAMS